MRWTTWAASSETSNAPSGICSTSTGRPETFPRRNQPSANTESLDASTLLMATVVMRYPIFLLRFHERCSAMKTPSWYPGETS